MRYYVQGIYEVTVHSTQASSMPGIVAIDASITTDHGTIRGLSDVDASKPAYRVMEDMIRERYLVNPGTDCLIAQCTLLVERGREEESFRVLALLPQEESADIHDIHRHHSVTVGHDGINTCECGARWLNMIGRGALDLALQGR